MPVPRRIHRRDGTNDLSCMAEINSATLRAQRALRRGSFGPSSNEQGGRARASRSFKYRGMKQACPAHPLERDDNSP